MKYAISLASGALVSGFYLVFARTPDASTLDVTATTVGLLLSVAAFSYWTLSTR